MRPSCAQTVNHRRSTTLHEKLPYMMRVQDVLSAESCCAVKHSNTCTNEHKCNLYKESSVHKLHGSHIKHPRASQVPGRHPTVQPAELCSHLISLWYQKSLAPIPVASAGAKAGAAFALPLGPLGFCQWLIYCRAYIQCCLQSGSSHQVPSSCAKGGIKLQGIKGIKVQECLSSVVEVDFGFWEECRHWDGENLWQLQTAFLVPLCFGTE